VTEPDAAGAYAAALAGLERMSATRLSKLLAGTHPTLAWQAVKAGKHPCDPQRQFRASARATDVSTVAARYRRAGAGVLVHGATGYPPALLEDPNPPAVLFRAGDTAALESSATVAIVGTRSATAYGRRVAAELGLALAEEGIVVVSGLARGIDAAAHTGALRASGAGAARPVAVVGTGLDVVYPESSADLWEKVARRGAVITESPLGTAPQPWVFPARNRIIAGLADVVVVVECHLSGGSLTTVEAAARRSVPVCVVPGSVHSPASAGTNALLVDGCTPIRDATDVLVAVSLARAGAEPRRPTRVLGSRRHRVRAAPGAAAPVEDEAAPTRVATTEEQRVVLAAVDETPTIFETILLRTSLSIPDAAHACEELADAGLLTSGPGWWSRD
jgi:DNA processing protein